MRSVCRRGHFRAASSKDTPHPGLPVLAPSGVTGPRHREHPGPTPSLSGSKGQRARTAAQQTGSLHPSLCSRTARQDTQLGAQLRCSNNLTLSVKDPTHIQSAPIPLLCPYRAPRGGKGAPRDRAEPVGGEGHISRSQGSQTFLAPPTLGTISPVSQEPQTRHEHRCRSTILSLIHI